MQLAVVLLQRCIACRLAVCRLAELCRRAPHSPHSPTPIFAHATTRATRNQSGYQDFSAQWDSRPQVAEVT